MIPKLRFPEFTDEWQVNKVGALCEMKAGKFVSASAISANSSTDSSYLCYGGNGPRGYVSSYNHDGTYSLIGRQGALCGNVNFVSGKFYATEHALVVYPKSNIDEKWLYFQLKRLDLNKLATGQAQPGLSVDIISSVRQSNPQSSTEQQKIADFLTAVDKKIVLIDKRVELLKEYKKGVMQKIFTQQVRFKDENGKEYPDWRTDEIGKIAEVNPKISRLPDDFVYIDLESVSQGKLLFQKHIKAISAPSRAQRLLQKDDILFQTVRPYQQNNFYFNLAGEYVASTGYAQIRAKGSPGFLYQLIHTVKFVNDVLERCTGTSYPAINSNDLAKITVSVPTLVSEQQKIADFLSAIDDKIKAEETKLASAKKFKKALLQRMFV